MKAKVKTTGETVDVKPERDGFFIDEANSNAYKFDELEFIEETEKAEEEKHLEKFQMILPSLLQMPDFNKNEMQKFWAEKHIETIFKMMDFFKSIRDNETLLSTALTYSRAIMNDIQAYARGER